MIQLISIVIFIVTVILFVLSASDDKEDWSGWG